MLHTSCRLLHRAVALPEQLDDRAPVGIAMLPLIWTSMPGLQPSFEQFANGLKARSERAS